MQSDELVASSSGESLVAGALIADRYELVRGLGIGGMGIVWEARDVRSGERYALKFLKATGQVGSDGPDSVKRFLREARAAASVQHPHVVAIRELLEPVRGTPVLVMELLSGESMRAHLQKVKRLSIVHTANLLLPVASAVGSAHERGIIHRDLKPDNIFLSRDASANQVVKVLDFGIAKVVHVDGDVSQSVGLTATGEVLGTPNYMAPEQVFGERDIDQRADIWALGVILYECLSGKLPTDGANVGQVFKLIVAGGIKPIEEVVPSLPEEVVALVRRMLARVRTQRPWSLLDVVEVLGKYSDVAVPAFGAPQIRTRARASESDISSASSTTEDDHGRSDARAIDTLQNDVPGDTARIASTTSIPHGQVRAKGRVAGLGTWFLALSLVIGGSWIFYRSRTAPEEAGDRPVAAAPTPSPIPTASPPAVAVEPAGAVSALPATSASNERSMKSAPLQPKQRPAAAKTKEAEKAPRPALSSSATPMPGNIFEKPPF